MVPTVRPRKSRAVVTRQPQVNALAAGSSGATGALYRAADVHWWGLMEPDRSDPTVLWRMTRGRNTAHATVFPGPDRATVTWFIDGQMDRAENYDSMELALARADHIRSILAEDGWKDA